MLRRAFWHLIEWPIGLAWFAYALLVERTSKISIWGDPPPTAVFVNWHRYQPFLIFHHGRRHRWMLVSPAAKVLPVARFCRLSGLNLVRGTSGDRGKQAVEELVQILVRGESVTLAVDGPAGPAFQAKKGCADLAIRSGVPIVPVNYRCGHGVTISARWDRIYLPLPFNNIEVRYGTPIAPAGDLDTLLAAVQERLTAHEA